MAGTVLSLRFRVRIILIATTRPTVTWCLPHLFSVSCSASEELHKKLGGSTARTADPKLAREIFHTIKHFAHCVNWGSCCEGLMAAGRQAGHRSAGAEHLYWASLVPLGVYMFFSLQLLLSLVLLHITLSQLLNCFYLKSKGFFPPSPLEGGV